MTIIFSTREYQHEHGKAPKGYGYWGFEFEGLTCWEKGTLRDAKRMAMATIRKAAPAGYTGTVEVNILP